MITSVIGIDPGPTTGICFLDYVDDRPLPQHDLIQVVHGSAIHVLEAMLTRFYDDPKVTARHAQIEKFVTGRSAGTRGSAAEITRQYVMEIAERLQLHGYDVKIRSAADVKPWATDKRLGRILPATQPLHGDMKHACDAGRHALFAAVRDAHRKDPLA